MQICSIHIASLAFAHNFPLWNWFDTWFFFWMTMYSRNFHCLCHSRSDTLLCYHTIFTSTAWKVSKYGRIRTRNNSIFGHFSSCVRYSEYSSMFKFQNQAGLTKSSKWFIVIYHSTCVWWLISTKIKSTLVKLKELTNFANRQELTFYLIHTMDFV